MIRSLLWCVVFLCSSGCIGWSSGTALSPAATTLRERRSKVALHVNFMGPEGGDSASLAAEVAMDKRLLESATDVFTAGNYVVVEHDRADYFLDVKVREPDGVNGLPLLWISIATFTVIPGFTQERFLIEAELTAKDGRRIATRSIQEQKTVIVELLFLLATPFASAWHAQSVLWRNVFSDLAAWSDGELQKATAERVP